MLPESANGQQPIIAVVHVHPAEEMSSKSDKRGNTDQSERKFNYVRKKYFDFLYRHFLCDVLKYMIFLNADIVYV